jgi:nucleoside-diphosphate-sugar epimerase
MPATRTSASTERRSATIGAVNPPIRLGHHDDIAAVADGVDHGVGIIAQGRRVVVAGEIGRDHVVAPLAQHGFHQVPIPTDVAAAVDQRERRHRTTVKEAVERAEPEVVIHQMSGLSGAKDFKRFDAEFAATNRLRTQGTDHLLAGAKAAGVARFIAQSFGNWNYERTGSGPKTEQDLLDPDPPAEPARHGRALRADDPGCARLVGRGGHRPATQWYRSGRL